jgi:hypothetical protein
MAEKLSLRMKTRLRWQGEKLERKIYNLSTRNLYKFGGAVRREHRKLLDKSGKRNGPSKPGEPPRKITGILRDSSKFSVDKNQRSVTNLVPQQFDRSAADVPGILEFGGVEEVRLGILFGTPGAEDANVIPMAEWETMNSQQQAEAGRTSAGRFRARRLINSKKLPPVDAYYEPRPALIPAFETKQDELIPELWEDLL